MNNEMMKKRIQQALNAETSGVRTSEAERARLFENATGGIKVKRKLTVGLVFAIVLVLLAAAAVATVLLTHQEIVEQVAVPMAQEEGPKDGMMRVYTPDELATLVQALSENGFTLEENNIIVQAIKNGSGYYADETIMEICRQAFGGLIGTWTIEEQDWYNRILYECGSYENYKPNLPGEDNMTYEEAEAFAFSALKKKYGEDLQPEDRTVYTLERFFWTDPEDGEAVWDFNLTARDLDHASYTLMFKDRDPEGTLEMGQNARDWTQPYTADDLVSAFYPIYGWAERDWPQAAWKKLHEMMQNAQLESGDGNYRKHRGYLITAYPDPEEGEISREEAVRAAEKAVGNEQAAMDSAVLTEYEGKRAWLVGLSTGHEISEWDEGVPGLYVVTVDSRTGSVESVRQGTEDDDGSMAFVPEAAYEKAGEGLLKKSEFVRIAAEAVQKKYPELEPLNEAEFKAVYQPAVNFVGVCFRTRNIRHGNAEVTMTRDGAVREVTADMNAPDGDSLLARYRSAYGYYSEWDQSVWVRLAKDIEPLEPTGIEGKLLKLGRFPEESTVSIGHEQARELAVRASGLKTADPFTCVLVDAQPHPVWVMRVMSASEWDRFVTLDAETGEILSSYPYKTDFTPDYVLYSTEQNRRRLEMEINGPVWIARMEAAYAFGNLEMDWPLEELDYPDEYDTVQDGLTVRFLSREPGRKNYEVELDEKGYVLRCEETDAE